MQVTYLNHSGFLIEHKGMRLIIDCFDPDEYPFLASGPALALISHAHPDHFGKAILKRPDTVFLGDEKVAILASREGAAVTPLDVGERAKYRDITVTAYGSTDEGLSFHIEWDGVSLFHAGDLNNWHWLGEADPDYARDAQNAFLSQLETVRRGVEKVDVAFFPVDPRLGADYWRGAVQFAKKMRPKTLVPMHAILLHGLAHKNAVPIRTLLAPEFFDAAAPYTQVVCPTLPGEPIDIPALHSLQ